MNAFTRVQSRAYQPPVRGKQKHSYRASRKLDMLISLGLQAAGCPCTRFQQDSGTSEPSNPYRSWRLGNTVRSVRVESP